MHSEAMLSLPLLEADGLLLVVGDEFLFQTYCLFGSVEAQELLLLSVMEGLQSLVC